MGLSSALQERFAACKLVLHPEKTKLVYCKDEPRWRLSEQSFHFLGFTFRARKALGGDVALCVLPARRQSESVDGHQPTVRRWALHHRSDKSLQDLAETYNRCIHGWINYYSHFYKTQLRPTLKRRSISMLPLGAPQVQAVASQDQGGARLV